GRTAGESEISGSASSRSRRSACIPRFTPRAYSAREATASSYCRMLTVASAFIVRTMERRSSVVSSRLRIASVVCIGFGSEGFLDAATGQREDPPALLVGERLPPFDAGPYLGKLAADRLPDDAFRLRDFRQRERIEEPRGQREEGHDLRGGGHGRVLRLLQHLANPLAARERAARVVVEPGAEAGEGLQLLELGVRKPQVRDHRTVGRELRLSPNPGYRRPQVHRRKDAPPEELR